MNTTTIEVPTIRLGDAIRAEATKILTHPATPLMLFITLAANLVLAGVEASGVTFYTGGPGGPSSLSSFGIVMLAPVYAFLVIPVYATASEYQGGQLRMSLAATPRRGAFVLSKLAATFAVVLIAAVVAVVPARLVIGIADGLAPAALAADCGEWVAVYVFMSLIGFGLAGVLRGAIAPLGIMIALPIVVATGILQWPAGIRLLPDQTALSLVGTPGYDVTELPPGAAALVLIAWTILAVSAYGIALARRDA